LEDSQEEDEDMFDQQPGLDDEDNQLAATNSASEQTLLENKFVFWVTIVDSGANRRPAGV
jgi:hypothetical protein